MAIAPSEGLCGNIIHRGGWHRHCLRRHCGWSVLARAPSASEGRPTCGRVLREARRSSRRPAARPLTIARSGSIPSVARASPLRPGDPGMGRRDHDMWQGWTSCSTTMLPAPPQPWRFRQKFRRFGQVSLGGRTSWPGSSRKARRRGGSIGWLESSPTWKPGYTYMKFGCASRADAMRNK